jgi:hypothetical protein
MKSKGQNGALPLGPPNVQKTLAGRSAPEPPDYFSFPPKKSSQKKGVFARSQVCCLKRARPATHYPSPALRVYSSSPSNSSPSKQGALPYGPDIAHSQKKRERTRRMEKGAEAPRRNYPAPLNYFLWTYKRPGGGPSVC